MKFTFQRIEHGLYHVTNRKSREEHIVRFMAPTDQDDVLAIERKSYTSHFWCAKDFSDLAGVAYYFVSEKDRKVTGFMVCEEDGTILNIAVNPGDRRRGFATSLIELLKYTKDFEFIERIAMSVREKNTAAQLLCRSQELKAGPICKFGYDTDHLYPMQWNREKIKE